MFFSSSSTFDRYLYCLLIVLKWNENKEKSKVVLEKNKNRYFCFTVLNPFVYQWQENLNRLLIETLLNISLLFLC